MPRSPIVAALMMWGWAGVALAAEPASTFDWSGFYAGVGVGGSATQVHTGLDVRPNGANSYATGNDFDDLHEAGAGTIWDAKPIGAVQIGYLRQDGQLVSGIELNINSLSLDDRRFSSALYTTGTIVPFNIDHRVRAHWQATLGPRLSWAQGNWLATASAGLAVTQVMVDTRIRDFNGKGLHGDESKTEFQIGWSLGLSAEYALTRNWSLRAGVLFADFGDINSQSMIRNATFSNLSNVVDHSTRLDTYSALIGLTYRFNGP